MSRFRSGNPDANQAAIINLYRRCGWSVAITSQVGGGFPDLVVAKHGDDTLVEIKYKKGKLRQSQINFCLGWQGKPIALIRTEQEALQHIQTGVYPKLRDFIKNEQINKKKGK